VEPSGIEPLTSCMQICVIIRIIVVVEDEIILFFRFFGFLGLRVFGVSNHCAGLGRVDRNLSASVWANDRCGVQIVEAFAGFWAKTLCSPFFLWHGLSLQILSWSCSALQPTAISEQVCQSL